MSTLPLVMSISGPVSASPANIRTTLINNVAATNPDYTANLPGTLIEDIASTDVAAIAQIDQARVDAVNSITPYGANAFILSQLGAQFGIPQGTGTNTSAYVVFTGSEGYGILPGFVVSDGSHDYVVQSGGVIKTGGQSDPIYVVASDSGSWAVPANTITTVQTSVQSPYTLTVTNPTAGVSGTSAESVEDYRGRVIEAEKIAGQATPDYLKTLLKAIPGVNPRLVSIKQAIGGWNVICGGGDSYQVGYAILQGTLDLSTIVGSATSSRNITVSIINAPDTYNITYINPPLQTVTINAVWNTNATGFAGTTSVNQLSSVALRNYINGIKVGQPINEYEMIRVFQDSISNILSAENLTAINFTVFIDGVEYTPSAGTGIISGDSEGYFYSGPTDISVVKG